MSTQLVHAFDATNWQQRLNALKDLASVGINLDKPRHVCFYPGCGKSTLGWSEGLLLDDLCEEHCSDEFDGLRQEFLYTNETVLVSGPVEMQSKVRVVWNGVDEGRARFTMRIGVVRISGKRYILYPHSVTSDTSDLLFLDGNKAHEYGVKVGLQHLTELHRTQAP